MLHYYCNIQIRDGLPTRRFDAYSSESLTQKIIMYCVYVLKSCSSDKFYIGYTVDLARRLIEHNKGASRYTNHDKPWKLVYAEAYASEDLARNREKQLKRHGQAWTALKIRAGL